MKQRPVRTCKKKNLEMVSKRLNRHNQTVSTQTENPVSFNNVNKSNSSLSYGSETEEDIDLCDIKPTVTEFFVKIESEISEPVVCKTEVPELSSYNDIFARSPRVVLQRIEIPLQVPKSEPVSDADLSPVNNFSPSEMDMIEDSFSDDKTTIYFEESEKGEVTSPSDSESRTLGRRFIRARKKVKKRHLTVSQMSEIIQNDNGFFRNKKQWMTEKVLRQLPDKDKIFLSNILRKFMKRNKFKNKK